MDERRRQTYSIWPFLAVFLLLTVVGLYLFVVNGSFDRAATSVRPDIPATTDPTATTTTEPTPVTMLDGSDAPEGVFDVETEAGRHVYLFRLPAGFTDEPTSSVVAPTLAQVVDDGNAVQVVMTCAVSADSVPAAVRINEDPFEVSVMAVAIGHTTGDQCDGGQLADITIPLEAPVGSRRVVLERPGTPVTLAGIG